MEDQTNDIERLQYLAGLFDGAGWITVSIKKSDQNRIGYLAEPSISARASGSDHLILANFAQFCDRNNIQYSIREQSHGNEKGRSEMWVINKERHIARFLEFITPYLTVRYERAVLMMDKVVPAMIQGEHLTKQGFYDMMDVVDEIRNNSRRSNIKYTKSHFEEKWDLD